MLNQTVKRFWNNGQNTHIGKVLTRASGLLLACVIGLGSAAASANTFKELGVYRNWTAVTFTEGNRTTCYMTSKPTKFVPRDKDRHGDVTLYVTHFPGEGVKNEVSLVVGYNWHRNSPVSAQVGGKRTDMYTQDKVAWVTDIKQLPTLVNDMRKGSTIKLTGKSRRGTSTEYTFSLSGFTAAHKAISQACNVK